jgi:hypothetical protein
MFRWALAVAAVALGLCCAAPAAAQVKRNFPANALRGEIVVEQPPIISLNGQATRLTPGARIRGQNNMLQMSGALVGIPLLVHYTLDKEGLVHDVWILTDEERAKSPWPTTPQQAQTWAFDPAAQVWSRR